MARELGTKTGEERSVTEARDFCRQVKAAFGPGVEITVKDRLMPLHHRKPQRDGE